MGQLRLQNIDVTSAKWTPPRGWRPDTGPVPGDPNRATFVPAFAARPTYLPAAGPPAAPMGHPMYLEYYAQTSGAATQAAPPANRYIREVAERFYQAQVTRVGGDQMMPRFGDP